MASTIPPSAPEQQHPLTADLGWLLYKAAFALKTQVTRALEDVGISPRQHHVLMAASCGQSTQSALAATIGLDKTTLVSTLDDLERQGFVARQPVPGDRRARHIVLTPDGEATLAKGQAVVARLQAEVLDVLPARERDVFLEALADLVEDRLSDPMPGDVCRPQGLSG